MLGVIFFFKEIILTVVLVFSLMLRSFNTFLKFSWKQIEKIKINNKFLSRKVSLKSFFVKLIN